MVDPLRQNKAFVLELCGSHMRSSKLFSPPSGIMGLSQMAIEEGGKVDLLCLKDLRQMG